MRAKSPTAKPARLSAATSPSESRTHRCIASRALLEGQREVRIRHGDVEYRLRHTASNKLILTK